MVDARQKVMGDDYVYGWGYGPDSKFYGRSNVLLAPENYLKNPWLTHTIDNKKWEIYYTKELFFRYLDQPGWVMKNA